jgi:hypothetical protein
MCTMPAGFPDGRCSKHLNTDARKAYPGQNKAAVPLIEPRAMSSGFFHCSDAQRGTMQQLHYPSGFAHNATRSEYLDGSSSGSLRFPASSPYGCASRARRLEGLEELDMFIP